jgi:hypothetical protein
MGSGGSGGGPSNSAGGEQSTADSSAGGNGAGGSGEDIHQGGAESLIINEDIEGESMGKCSYYLTLSWMG